MVETPEDRIWNYYVSLCAMVERNCVKIFFLFFGGYNILCWYAHTETFKRSILWNIPTVNLLGWLHLPLGVISWGFYIYLVNKKDKPICETTIITK